MAFFTKHTHTHTRYPDSKRLAAEVSVLFVNNSTFIAPWLGGSSAWRDTSVGEVEVGWED